MRIRYECQSDVGCVRKLNQDMAMVNGVLVRDGAASGTVTIPEEKACLGAIVCDGLGGHADGEVAAEMACTSFRDYVKDLNAEAEDNEIVMGLKQWFGEANAAIITAGNGKLMCTTLTGMLICGNRVFILNAGDSRTYRERYDDLQQLTTDHSERERTGDLSVPASRIYNCMGLANAFLDIRRLRVIAGDRYLVCSDGLSGVVSEEMLHSEIGHAENLLKGAILNGGPDNITLISLEISD